MRRLVVVASGTVLGALVAISGTSRADALFAAAFRSFDVGTQPNSVAIADLNGDGKPDLAVVNSRSYTVSVLLGNGDGTFRAKADYGPLGYRTSLAIADLNGDGKPDLVVAGGLKVTVLLGNGDGTFDTGTDYATGDTPVSLAIADLNGDGRPDLATANDFANTVSVLLGNGDGTFGAKSDYATAWVPHSVAIADLNGDGKPDLAVAGGDPYPYLYVPGTVSILLGKGDGTFGAKTDYGLGIKPHSVAIGDLNGDGKPDLAVASGLEHPIVGPGTVSVLLGNGDGTFGAKID